MQEIKLTQYSKGSGCGCKIAPDVLEKILHTDQAGLIDKNLIVGNSTRDDAAVYDIGNNKLLVSTVDFFTPIVDDPFTFGKIASANAISDVYAMGGNPLFATAILGWPVDKLPAELAGEVLKGARDLCTEAGIVLAGGHSVDTQDPIFGLSVNGITESQNLKTNSGAREGDLLYVTKRLGTGILSAALKRGQISEEHKTKLIDQLCTLNQIGAKFGKLNYVSAMTDITGFGFLGHLIEMTTSSGLSAVVESSKIPLLDGTKEYAEKMIVPDNLYRNWNSYEKKVKGIGPLSFFTLNDPQTNGALLVAIDPKHQENFEAMLHENGLKDFAQSIGRFTKASDHAIELLD